MDEPLFYQGGFGPGGLPDVLEQHRQNAVREIDQIAADRLLATPTEALLAEIKPRAMVEPLVVDEEHLDKHVEDVPPDRTRVRYILPFQGDQQLWKLTPSSFGLNHPRGQIKDHTLVVTFEERHLDPQAVRAQFENNMKLIRSNLATSKQDVERSNQDLRHSLRDGIERRRAKLERDRQLTDQL
jgi:hypothetical protein